jgi:hypothetical protein
MRLLIRAGNSPFQPAEAKPPNRPGFGNSGNTLFAHSVYKAFFKPENQIDITDYRADFAPADEINEKYDAFVLPMANAFRPQFETELKQHTKLIRRLKIPCVVVGVGVQAGLDLAELKGAPIDQSVRQFVAAILDRSTTIGVRGEFTHEYLKRLGFGAVDVIGCPSMFFNGANMRVEKANTTIDIGDKIALNHSPEIKHQFEKIIRDALHDYPNSIFVAQQKADIGLWDETLPTSRIRYFKDVPPWITFMKTRIFSIGTRIHGNIAAVLSGIPSLVLTHDSRTLELSMYHNIPHLSNVAENIRFPDLYDFADFAAFNMNSAALFDHYKAFLEKNGLDHAYNNPQCAIAFENRMAAIEYPNRLNV